MPNLNASLFFWTLVVLLVYAGLLSKAPKDYRGAKYLRRTRGEFTIHYLRALNLRFGIFVAERERAHWLVIGHWFIGYTFNAQGQWRPSIVHTPANVKAIYLKALEEQQS